MPADPRIRHQLTDGRAYLLKGQTRYDIIEADALRPNSAYAGNLYSAEYFSLLRSRLEPGGFAVTWVPTPRVLTTMVSAFPHVLHARHVAIGSDRPIAFDPAEVRARLERPFSQRYYTAGGIDIRAQLEPYLRDTPRVYGPDDHRTAGTDVNRDLFPRDEFGARRR